MTRKEKVAKKNAEKQAQVVTPIDNHRIENAIDDKSIVKAQLQEVPEVPSLTSRSVEAEDTLTSMKGPRAAELGMSIDENGGVKYPEYQTNAAYAIRDIEQKMPTGATQQKVAGAPNGVNIPKPKTLSDYLAEQRANLQKDKTDAAKMQKYYALTDVFNALGKMGGAAVGGAIGGNVLDSAPAVGEYQQSRGYLDAFERAKQANEKLRALDEKEFNLAYSKQERDEERAYAEKQKAEQRAHEAEQKAEERAYKAKMEEEDRKFQKEMADYRAKIEQAATEGNLRLKAQLEAEAAEKEYAHEAAMKELSLEITRMQMSGKNSGGSSKSNEKSKSVIFNDKTKMDIPDSAYDAIVDALMDSEINGEYVDKDNVKRIIRDNPKLIKEYMTILGYGDEGSAGENEVVGGEYYYNPYTDTSMKSPIPSNVGDYQHANGVSAEEFDKEFSQFEE